MKTKAQFIEQCKAENPTMVQTLNDVKFELTEAEYNNACEAWAESKYLLQTLEAEAEAKATAKAALLERLGITAEEATLLLS